VLPLRTAGFKLVALSPEDCVETAPWVLRLRVGPADADSEANVTTFIRVSR